MKYAAKPLQLEISKITVGDRLRPVDKNWVKVLAGMVDESGLQNPVIVREQKGKKPHKLVAGAHRIAAVRENGETHIDARLALPETDAPELEFRMIEITENLGRNELGPLDRAANLAELKRVYEELYPEAKAGVAGGKAGAVGRDRLSGYGSEEAASDGKKSNGVGRPVRPTAAQGGDDAGGQRHIVRARERRGRIRSA